MKFHAFIALYLALSFQVYANNKYELSAAEADAVKHAFEEVLIDPTSPVFSDFDAAITVTGVIGICGTVNSKNRLGGFTGKTAFFGTLRDGVFEIKAIAQDDDGVFKTAEYCRLYGVWK